MLDMAPSQRDMQRGRSESGLLEEERGCEEAECEVVVPRGSRRKRVSVYDRVDPEDSIRDMVSENDFYRWVVCGGSGESCRCCNHFGLCEIGFYV